jgi:hypothetical protein
MHISILRLWKRYIYNQNQPFDYPNKGSNIPPSKSYKPPQEYKQMAPSHGPKGITSVQTNLKDEPQQVNILTPNEAMAKGNTPSNSAANAFNIMSNKPEASPITENPDEISKNLNEQEDNHAVPADNSNEDINQNEEMDPDQMEEMNPDEMGAEGDEMDGNEMEGDLGQDPNDMEGSHDQDPNEMDADNQDPDMQGVNEGED